MPRGQEQVNRGGQLDPYVQESLGRGRATAENRLATAMREKGAGERQRSSEQASATQQGVQVGANAYQAAAQQAQQDKRAAEAEKARREEMELRQAEMEITETFHNDSLALQREQLELTKQGLEYDKELSEKQMVYDDLLASEQMAQSSKLLNGMLSITRVGQNNEARTEKAKTAIHGMKKKYQQSLDMYDISKDAAANFINNDRTMELSPGYVGVTKTGISSVPVGEEMREEGEVANPFKTLQKATSLNKSNINVASLVGQVEGATLEKQIADGEVDPTDITGFMAAVEPMITVLDEKIASAELGIGKQKKEELKIWRDYRGKIAQMKSTIKNLSYSDTKIQGSDTETVGARVRSGLAPTDPMFSPTSGAIITRTMEANNDDLDAVMAEMTQGQEPIRLYDIPEDATAAQIEAINRRNAIIKRAFPGRFPDTELADIGTGHSFME